MTDAIARPEELRLNAWTGRESPLAHLASRTPWALKTSLAAPTRWLAPGPSVDGRNWQHPDVGWGLVLPDDNPTLDDAAKARGDDVPNLRPLLEARPNSPVLRYRPELQQGYLRRYYTDGPPQDLSAQAPNPGTARGRIPQYLLIVGGPDKIPWAVQYALNMSNCVGRLDLPEAGLRNYVDALIHDWAGQTTQPRAPLVWTVDFGQPDITWLMARAVGRNLWDRFAHDANNDYAQGVLLDGEKASSSALGQSLAEHSPSLIVTTSHGMTGPLEQPDVLKAQLGAPVDIQRLPLSLNALSGWKPCGAIWYAQACCSAGSDAPSRYKDLFADGDPTGSLLRAIATAAGPMVAPLAKALLGHEQPLRAFIGHVEPTFDWTLRDPANKQVLTPALCTALYDKLCQQDMRTPVGHALQAVYKEAGAFYGAWQSAVREVNQNMPGPTRDWALYRQLVAMDRQTMVILGDPTVALPLLR